MDNLLNISYNGKPAYNIVFKADYSGLTEHINALGMTGRRYMIISDSNTGSLYKDELISILEPVAKSVHSFTFPAGEASKNLDTVNQCYEQLILAGLDRNDLLIALGGGVVGDLTGFVAATYLRGIRFIQAPTSLLAMVDSSIGGKTGVDYKAYKNMVGAFHQPSLVYMNLSTLKTLPDAEYFSGMGEIIKHGLIKDLALYNWLKVNQKKITAKDYNTLHEMIYRSCRVKKDVVERDPQEKGERALLNFGHTIGHSIEKLMNFKLLHGECVCIGMAAAAYISMKKGNINHTEYNDILETISLFNEPIKVAGLSAGNIYEVTRLDKKMDSGTIRFILLDGIGSSVIDTSITKDDMIEAINTVID
jgi:3-dehydroquinate synthase